MIEGAGSGSGSEEGNGGEVESGQVHEAVDGVNALLGGAKHGEVALGDHNTVAAVAAADLSGHSGHGAGPSGWPERGGP